MNRLTYRFLMRCKKYGLKRVCIGVSHPIVPESVNFTFGPHNSVFGIKSPKGDSNYDDWPAIWQVVRDLKIVSGCGNHNQHNAHMEGLERGAYRLYNGVWRKVA